MVSGAFFAFAAIRFGVERIRVDIINGEGADLQVGRWFTLVVTFLVPLEFVVMLSWWLIQATSWEPQLGGPVPTSGCWYLSRRNGDIILITFMPLPTRRHSATS